MNAANETHPHTFSVFLRESTAGSSLTEGVGAVSTIILAILGLAGVFTNIVASVATIIIGAVILTDGMLLSAAAHRYAAQGGVTRTAGIGSGVTAGFFGGMAAIVLGILSFFKMSPWPLLSVALLVVGAAMLLGGGAMSWLFSDSSPAITGSGSTFVGLAAVVLGILAVIGLVPMTMVLVGLLCLGAAALFNGSHLGAT